MSEGYRTPARPASAYDEILRDLDEPRLTHPSSSMGEGDDELGESAPVVRLANALLLNALKKEASLIRIEPSSGSSWVRFMIDGAWSDEVEVLARWRGAASRRVKVMASLPTERSRVPRVGRISLLLGKGREVFYRVFVLPSVGGERLLIRLVSKEQALGLWGPVHDDAEAVAGRLRWDLEHAARLVRGESPEAAEAPARFLLDVAESLGPAARPYIVEARKILASIAEARGADDEALSELRAAVPVADVYFGLSLAVAELYHGIADVLLKRCDMAGGLSAQRKAADTIARCLGQDDRQVADLLQAQAVMLAGAGLGPEALACLDQAVGWLARLTGDDDVQLQNLMAARERVQ